MKKYMITLLVLLSMLTVTACGKKAVNTPGDDTGKDKAPAPTITAETSDETTSEQDANSEQETTGEKEKTEIRIAALKGPTAIGMVKLMEDAAADNTPDDYTFTIAGTADEISAGLVKGNFDVAAVPCNLASVLYNKTEGQIKLAGINTLGVLYIVETGNTINTVEDLKGKTIYSTGLGTTPQYTLNYLLRSHGINPEKDVSIEYKTEATEVAAVLSASDDAIAMLPQPYVTTVMMNNDKVRIALDVEKEWEAVSTDNSSVVTGVLIVKSDFLEANKEAFDALLEEYSASVEYVNGQVDDAAALVEKYDIFKAGPMKKAIPLCNIVLIQGTEMKDKVDAYLKVLFDQKPEAVGGKLPDDGFYYIP